jgi:hypothetical protein
VWFAQLPVHGSYLADLLGPSLLIALGLGFAFVPITILAETGVHDREYGLASGLVNASQQIGGALGLAVLTTIATSRTNHLIASHHPFGQALTLGFHSGFLGAAGFAGLGIIAAASIGTRRVKRGQLPQRARRTEPQPWLDRIASGCAHVRTPRPVPERYQPSAPPPASQTPAHGQPERI